MFLKDNCFHCELGEFGLQFCNPEIDILSPLESLSNFLVPGPLTPQVEGFPGQSQLTHFAVHILAIAVNEVFITWIDYNSP